MMIRAPAYQDSVSTLETKSVHHLKKDFGVFCGDHRFEELPFAMPAKKIAMVSCYTDHREAISLGRKRVVMVGNHTWNGEGQLVAEMESADPESFRLEFN